MTIPVLHLIHGYIGAGKTTFAKKLETDTGAVRFTHDEWMVALYGDNPPAGEFGDYYARIESMIWQLAADLLRHKVSVILDFGFWSRAGRDLARLRALELGAQARLYSVECPEHIARARTATRTADMPHGALMIDDAAFDVLKAGFEPLAADEAAIRVESGA